MYAGFLLHLVLLETVAACIRELTQNYIFLPSGLLCLCVFLFDFDVTGTINPKANNPTTPYKIATKEQ